MSPPDHAAMYGTEYFAGVDADGLGEQVGDRFGFDLFDGRVDPGAVFVVEFDVCPLVEQGLQRLGWFEVVADRTPGGRSSRCARSTSRSVMRVTWATVKPSASSPPSDGSPHVLVSVLAGEQLGQTCSASGRAGRRVGLGGTP